MLNEAHGAEAPGLVTPAQTESDGNYTAHAAWQIHSVAWGEASS